MYTAEYYFAEIVSAILGISYPFIYQIIARIDDKYHSINLVRLFRKGMAFRIYNILLLVLLPLAVLMPCLTVTSGNETPFEWVSVQGVAMLLIGAILGVLVLLFVEIGRYYDPNDLHIKIERKLKNRADSLRQELKSLDVREQETKKILRASLFSQYWISDYDKDCCRKTIQKCQNRRRKIIDEEIPNDLTFKCMTDMLKFSIRDNDVSLYLKFNELLFWCVIQAGMGKKNK